MKIKFLVAGLLALASTAALAQSSDQKKAREEYNKYEALKEGSPALAVASLKNAKEAVDKAAINKKTANDAQTFALKGLVYAAMAAKDSVESTSKPLFDTATVALKKAVAADTKDEFKELTDNGNRYVAQVHLNNGVRQYQAKDYVNAYTSFDSYRQILPEDTNAIYYTAISALNAGSKSQDSKYLPLAITNYQKLLTTNYSKKADIYDELTTVYLANKDTASALKAVSEGVEKFPTSTGLRTKEIEISLVTGKEADVLSKIQAAIANSPNDKQLYYYAGITYAKIATNADKSEKAAKTAAAKAPFAQKRAENYTKAAEMYKKALAIDPNFADAALNLGFVMINPAIDTYNAAINLPVSKQKEYDAGIAKANKLFEEAKPYLLKAVELNPKSPEALGNLKTYYVGTKDVANAKKVQDQINALGGGAQ